MKKLIIFIIPLIFLLNIISCEDYVQDVDPFIDKIEDERLNSEDQFLFLIRGVEQRFATTVDDITILAGGLSDELYFTTNVQGATYPTYREIDLGVNIQYDNNSVDNAFTPLGELRKMADELVLRANNVTFTDQSLQNEAYYTGYLYGGIARFFYAAYFGLNPDEGGGVIDNGPFIPSDDMYALAVEKLTLALNYAASVYDSSVVNTMLARCYLYNEEYANALTAAESGLQQGDDPLEALYHPSSENGWFYAAGHGRTQYTMDPRYHAYIDAEPLEANRIVLFPAQGRDGNTYYFPDKSPERDDPLVFATWQENNLILAELALRGFGSGDPLTLANEVRASYKNDVGEVIPDLAAIDMPTLIEERDKELFTTGARLVDQRRFDADYGLWHLDQTAWKYLPITSRERNENPNF